MTSAENRDRGHSLGHDSGMRGSVDANGQSRHHDRSRPRERGPDPGRNQASLVGRPASANDGDGRGRCQRREGAADEEKGRRHVDAAQPLGVLRVVERYHRQVQRAHDGQRSVALGDLPPDPVRQVGADRSAGADFTIAGPSDGRRASSPARGLALPARSVAERGRASTSLPSAPVRSATASCRRAAPFGPAAATSVARADPNAASSAAKVTGPSPGTARRMTQASRSSAPSRTSRPWVGRLADGGAESAPWTRRLSNAPTAPRLPRRRQWTAALDAQHRSAHRLEPAPLPDRRTEASGLVQVMALDAVRAGKIRGRPSDPQQPLGTASRPAFEIGQANRLCLGRPGQVARRPQRPAAQSRIEAALPLDLAPARPGHSLGYRCRSLGAGLADVLLRTNSRHVDPQVDPVAQRARHAACVPINKRRLAPAPSVALAGMTARASLQVTTTPSCAG